jgi:hypothetical protein
VVDTLGVHEDQVLQASDQQPEDKVGVEVTSYGQKTPAAFRS